MCSRAAQTASKCSVGYTELPGEGTELSRNLKLEGFHYMILPLRGSSRASLPTQKLFQDPFKHINEIHENWDRPKGPGTASVQRPMGWMCYRNP